MPTLDVGEVLLDPEIADRFKVWRRREAVDATGIESTNSQLFWPVYGVVTQAGGNDLVREPDATIAGRTISVVTRFSARCAAQGYQPDVIEWNGNRYVIDSCDNYDRFGRGFVQVTATAIEYTVKPPETFDNG